MKRIILPLLFACTLLPATAQQHAESYYAQPERVQKNEAGFVVFQKHYNTPGASRDTLFNRLLAYTQSQVVEGADHLPQSRITEYSATDGVIAASMEEYLYFKRSAVFESRVRFYYQLIFHIADGGYIAEVRNLRYLYDDVPNQPMLRAESYITNESALGKKGQMRRKEGKFRTFTIDRIEQIFDGAARAATADRE